MGTAAIVLSVLAWGLENADRAADLVARHQAGEKPLTDEEAKAIIASKQGESDQLNQDWKNA